MNRYVLDTSALLTYIENEQGVEKVERILHEAIENKVVLFISIVSCIEIYYISWREQGKKVALERLELIDRLPFRQEKVEKQLIKIAGEIKAKNKISFADSCIAGLAKFRRAKLIHKDPEFEQLENEIEQIKLPYKQKISNK